MYFVKFSGAANILFFNGLGEGSHYTVAAEIAKELVRRNHSVTFLISNAYKERSNDPIHSKLFKFEIFEHSLPLDRVIDRLAGMTEAAFEDRLFWYQIANSSKLLVESNQDCTDLLDNEQVMGRLKAAKFDLTFYDPLWPCSAILADIIAAPYVALSPTSFLAAHCRMYGGETNTAIIPELGSGLPLEMTFPQRLKNTMWAVFNDLMVHFFIDTPFKTLESVPEKQKKKGVKKIFEETSLWIINSDPIIDIPAALMPNMIYVSGMSTKPAEPLPKDLEAFVQSSGDHGVIIFSMGGYVTHMPQEKVEMFAAAFAKIPQKVLWQWKSAKPPTKNLPANVRTMKWLPQNDLLGHNKTRLLIYQGGNNGLYEAIYHAVPLLVLPVLGDQSDVAQRVSERGIGKRLNVITIDADTLVKSIKEVLETPEYKQNVDYLSAVFHDRPHTAQQTVAFWTEHVLQFGAGHLRSPVHDLSFIELHMLDVYAFLLAVLFLFIYLLYRIMKCTFKLLLRLCRGKPKTD